MWRAEGVEMMISSKEGHISVSQLQSVVTDLLRLLDTAYSPGIQVKRQTNKQTEERKNTTQNWKTDKHTFNIYTTQASRWRDKQTNRRKKKHYTKLKRQKLRKRQTHIQYIHDPGIQVLEMKLSGKISETKQTNQRLLFSSLLGREEILHSPEWDATTRLMCQWVGKMTTYHPVKGGSLHKDEWKRFGCPTACRAPDQLVWVWVQIREQKFVFFLLQEKAHPTET